MGKIPAEKKERGAVDPHRPMPCNHNSEIALISSLMIQPDLMDEMNAYPSNLFYYPAHAQIFEVLRDMRTAMKPIDLVTITEECIKLEILEKIGGAAQIAELWTSVPTAANWGYYLQTLRESWFARRIITEASALVSRAYEITSMEEAETLLSDCESRLFSLRDQRRLDDDILSIKVVMERTLKKAEMAYTRRGHAVGIPSGFFDLDRMTGGCHKEELTILAARPSMGKSAMMGNMVRHQAVDCRTDKFPGYCVGVFSLEMPAEDNGARLLSDYGCINLKRFRDGFFKKNDLTILFQVSGEIAKGNNIFIDETAGITVQQFRAKARRMVSKFGVQIIYIDYLQLMRSSSKRAQEGREKEVAEISSLLKITARELKIPIIALAQLSRDAEGKEPKLSDLRESGSIEQDADVVLFPFRPDKGKTNSEEGVEDAKVLCAKQRNGPIGPTKLRFNGQFTRFENVTGAAFSNDPNKRQHDE